MRIVVRTVQILFALTFVVSGAAKCIDPAGTAIKLTEYLQYFGFGFLTDLTMGMAWVLSLLEFVCGFNLLLGHGRIFALLIGALLMLFFTPVTLWLALTDAIQECGCFGDLIHLTNWQTFIKNLVLDAMLVLLCVRHRDVYRLRGRTLYTLYIYSAFWFMVWLCWQGTWREPMIDFRPYLPGVNLREAVIGEGHAEGADTWYTCIYRRNGVEQEFDLEHLPDEADGWEFVNTLEHVGQRTTDNGQRTTDNGQRTTDNGQRTTDNGQRTTDNGQQTTDNGQQTIDERQQTIDFFVKTSEGEIFTDSLLLDTGRVILLLSPDLSHASQHDIDRIERLCEQADDHHYAFYCVTVRDTAQLRLWQYNTGAEYPFLFTDASIVQTICRSNPGVMVLHDGVIEAKSPLSIFDTEGVASANLIEQTASNSPEMTPQKRFLWLLVLLCAAFPLFLLFEIPKKIHFSITKKDSKDA